jgi:aspartyl-tRNA(Asn)/glutamyl-tRNA(Gln) amidotransferase subunit C
LRDDFARDLFDVYLPRRLHMRPYAAPAGISPTFYLIIYVKLACRNPKNTGLIHGFDKFLPTSQQPFAVLKIQYHNPTAAALLPTMSLALSDVKRLAILAQLDLTENQAVSTLDKLNGIFALVEQMKAVDTAGVEPLSQPVAAYRHDLALRLREDVVTEPNRREEYQKVAPAAQDGLYLVPKVIE